MENAVVDQFMNLDTNEFPDFHSYSRILDRGLWVLWVAKEKLEIKKLTANQIASIAREVKEVSILPSSIAQAFKRAGDKVYSHHEEGEIYYEIMRSGKEHLSSQIEKDGVELFYFEPGQKYSSKKFVTENILKELNGDLRIVDPYCGERTLDCLRYIGNKQVKFLTRIDNLQKDIKERFLRELKDFISENPQMEFRSYPSTDLHDRYIISGNSLVLLGHSIKDLGGKESFAIMLSITTSKNMIGVLSDNFDQRWKQSSII